MDLQRASNAASRQKNQPDCYLNLFTPPNYPRPIDAKLTQEEPGAEIRYTLDGGIPGTTDPLYAQSIPLANSATVRAKAFKNGYTRSITAQETFIVGE